MANKKNTPHKQKEYLKAILIPYLSIIFPANIEPTHSANPNAAMQVIEY
jgi:hypothetical protein